MARTVVGLDLGTSGVRAAKVTLGKSGPVLEAISELPLERGVIEGGEIKNVDAVVAAVKELWDKGGFKTKDVVVGVSNGKVIVRQHVLPWMEPAGLKESIKYQVQDEIAMPFAEANMDFHVLDEFSEGDERQIRILLVAADSEMVDRVVDVVQGAGLRPERADLNPFALIRAARPAIINDGSAQAIVDVGADVTNIVIHQDGQPRFVRIFASGGNQITFRIAESLAIPFDEAERLKREVSVSNASSGGMAPNVFGLGYEDASAEHPAQAVVNQSVASFVSEIRASLDYFLSAAKDIEGLSGVVLSGGGAYLLGLRERIAAELRIGVEFGTPITGIAHAKGLDLGDLVATEARMSVAVGLCLNGEK